MPTIIFIIILSVFIIIGICIISFARKIVTKRADKYSKIMRKLGMGDAPWASGTWPLGISFQIWILRTLGIFLIIGSIYILYRIVFIQ